MITDTSLLYFYEVARCGSIRQAAERLHVSPSAISRMITKAEHQFQATLFERRTKGMRLTAAGRILADQLGGVLTQLRDARTQIDELKGLHRGEVHLHCIEGIVLDLLPRSLAAFHERYPQITFRVYTGGTDAIVEALLADQADVGITFNLRRRPGIEVLFAFSQPLHAIVGADHPLNRRTSVALKEVIEYPIVMPDPSFGVRSILDRTLRRLGLAAPMLVTTNSISLTRGIAQTGAAVTFMPPFAASGELTSGQLFAVPIREQSLLNGTMSVCKRRGRALPAAARELVGFVREAFEQLREPGQCGGVPAARHRAGRRSRTREPDERPRARA